MNIEYREETPAVEDFLHLRATCLSARSSEAALKGLPNSLYGVVAVHESTTVGMGRVVGDGGLNFEVVDIAVLPEYQGRGIGRRIMEHIMDYLEVAAPESAYISLMADVPGLYEKFGFKLSRPETEGMYLVKGR